MSTLKKNHSPLLGWAVAMVVHGAVLGVLFAVEPPDKPRKRPRPPVKVKLVSTKKPPKVEPKAPEAKPAPEPPKIEKKAEIPQPKPKKRPDRKPPRSKPEPPKPAAEPAPPPPAQPPKPVKRFAISMEATVSTGGVAVPVAQDGRSSAVGAVGGDPDGVLRDKPAPKEPKPQPKPGPKQPRVVSAIEATTLPRLTSQPSPADLRRAYPPRARQNGLEGDVKLKILVSAEGRVEKVRILRRAGSGFDEAAVKLVKGFRFTPGRRGSRTVAVWIPWTYKFRLND